MDAVTSAETIYQLAGCSVLQLRVQRGRFVNYNYVVADDATAQAVVFDPAWEPSTVVGSIERAGLQLRAVLLTHSHPDHVDLCAQVSDHFACPVLMHTREVGFAAFDTPRLQEFEDLDTFFIGKTWVTPIHTPGHTPGSTCFLFPGGLVTGDTLFNEGCGVCHLRGGDAYEMHASLARLSREVSDSTLVFPGHAFHSLPGMRFGELRRLNAYLQIEDPTLFARWRLQRSDRTMDFI